MRMPRVQFTVRRMMAAVAVVGIFSFVVAMKWRRDESLLRLRYHTEEEEMSRLLAGASASSAELNRWLAEQVRSPFPELRPESRYSSRADEEYVFVPQEDEAEKPEPEKPDPDKLEQAARSLDGEATTHRARAEWHSTMKRKHSRAARHPWLPVAPDPPVPE